MALLAETASAMSTLLLALHANPKIAEVTRGLDITKYESPLAEEENSYTFESYVETETRDGNQFYWLLDIKRRPDGWMVERRIDKQFDGGAQSVRDFEDFRCEDFDELAKNHADLMNEFIKSADNFDFSIESE
jgi:hypothetical protein